MVRDDSSGDDDDIEDEVNEVIKKAAAGMNMVFYLPADFCPPSSEQMAESMAQLSLGPAAAIFEKPIDKKYRHLKPLYVKGSSMASQLVGCSLTRVQLSTSCRIPCAARLGDLSSIL